MGFSGSGSTKVDPLLWFDSAFRIEKLNSLLAKDAQKYQLDDLVSEDSSSARNDISIPLTNALSDSSETLKACRFTPNKF